MTQNRLTRYANSRNQGYDYILVLAMELAWGNSENVMEVLSVRRSNRSHFTNLQNNLGGA